MTSVEHAVADAHRREWASVLAATARVTRDLDAAEEAVQEAYVQALTTWTRDGVPDRPGAWLTTVARRTALNVIRRAKTFEAKLPLLLEPEDADMPDITSDAAVIPDDRLRLIFTCCHPAMSLDAQVALTLRLVCGVATGDIAQAFVVPETTMTARLTRAKKKIAAARIPYAVPTNAELPARAATRTDAHGRLLRLEEQDRSAWDRALIDEADHLVVAALRAGPPGRFTLQAAI